MEATQASGAELPTPQPWVGWGRLRPAWPQLLGRESATILKSLPAYLNLDEIYTQLTSQRRFVEVRTLWPSETLLPPRAPQPGHPPLSLHPQPLHRLPTGAAASVLCRFSLFTKILCGAWGQPRGGGHAEPPGSAPAPQNKESTQYPFLPRPSVSPSSYLTPRACSWV